MAGTKGKGIVLSNGTEAKGKSDHLLNSPFGGLMASHHRNWMSSVSLPWPRPNRIFIIIFFYIEKEQHNKKIILNQGTKRFTEIQCIYYTVSGWQSHRILEFGVISKKKHKQTKTKNLQRKGSHSMPMPSKVCHLIVVESILSKYFEISSIDRKKEFSLVGFEGTWHKIYNSMTFLVMQIGYIMKEASLINLRSIYRKAGWKAFFFF